MRRTTEAEKLRVSKNEDGKKSWIRSFLRWFGFAFVMMIIVE